MRRSLMAVPMAVLASLAVAAPVHADGPGTYGKNDAGGFRNVLPPGQNGLDTLGQILQFRANGSLPKHWADQQPLYDGLLYASPTLTDEQVKDYYKDATFGVEKKDRTGVVKPRKGVTIMRDKQYGVPRVYGKTRSDTMFGAGYVSANDRLFLMDVLRHTGRADLTNFLGGANLNADANQWQNNAYTEADLKKMLKAPAQGSLKEWKKLRKDVNAYVDGINAYIKAARNDDALLPGEYAAVGQKLKNWGPTDVMAVATLFGGIFGRGGGAEVTAAEILRALEALPAEPASFQEQRRDAVRSRTGSSSAVVISAEERLAVTSGLGDTGSMSMETVHVALDSAPSSAARRSSKIPDTLSGEALLSDRARTGRVTAGTTSSHPRPGKRHLRKKRRVKGPPSWLWVVAVASVLASGAVYWWTQLRGGTLP